MRYKLTGDLLQGNRYLTLTVIEWDFDKSKWLCRCDCGKECFKTSNDLKKLKIPCSCVNQRNREDRYTKMIGETHRQLTILSFYKNESGKYFLNCKCTCGNAKEVARINWGRIDSCGCLSLGFFKRMSINPLKDMSGKKIGMLTVRDWNVKKQAWLCDCDCGNQKYVPGKALRLDRIISCGCYRKTKAASDCQKLIGTKKFYLTCKGFYHDVEKACVYLSCKCKCGKMTTIQKGHWGKTSSCGCLKQEMRGEKCGAAKLTNKQAFLIRKLHKSKSGFNRKNLAEMFSVSVDIIREIILGTTYRDADE